MPTDSLQHGSLLWLYLWLALAIAFEVGWAIAMKLSDGFTRLWPTVVTIVLYFLSVVFLSFATKRMDVGTAYAIWAGSGMAIIAVIGMWYFKEPVTAMKIASLSLVAIGIVGLNLSTGGHGAVTGS
ncbi:MAG: multidrug efflux SMR transporter [Phycisphaerae bacterium]|jgi:multidrug transporter EmrE-like cation transporter|nr:multidrug efflux SMR transporter [Phycisphaerae bacterium]